MAHAVVYLQWKMYNYTRKALIGIFLILLAAACRTAQEPSAEEITSLKTHVQLASPPLHLHSWQRQMTD
jgi:hypothetical protein